MANAEAIEVVEGRDILAVDSPFLSKTTKRLLAEVLDQVDNPEGTDPSIAVEAVNALTEAFPTAHYRRLVDEMVIHTTDLNIPDAFVIAGADRMLKPELYAERMEARRINLEDMKSKFGVGAVFFSPSGFLGMTLTRGYALMLQIANPDFSPRLANDRFNPDGKTNPFFRDPISGRWVGKDYLEPVRGSEGNASMMGGFAPGPLGRQFVTHLERRLPPPSTPGPR